MRNSIFQGNPEFGRTGDTTCLAWHGLGHDPFVYDHDIITGVKNVPDPCPTDSLCDVAPGLVSTAIGAFDAHLLSDSPAIDAGTAVSTPVDDFDGRPRDDQPDIGAYEWWQPSAWIYLPLTLQSS